MPLAVTGGKKPPAIPKDQLPITTNADRAFESARDDATALVRETRALQGIGDRHCRAHVKLRVDQTQPHDKDTNPYLRDADGNIQRRPCKNYAIKGGTTCMSHGGATKAVRNRANKRLLVMVEPALVQLNEIVHQNEHMPAKLGAIRTILERAGANALGALQSQGQADTRPIINIGIKVGGIGAPVKVGILPAPAIEAEVVDDDGD